MHKYAAELKSGDTFILAGNIIKIIETYETNREDTIKILFAQPRGNRMVAGTMEVHVETLFVLN